MIITLNTAVLFWSQLKRNAFCSAPKIVLSGVSLGCEVRKKLVINELLGKAWFINRTNLKSERNPLVSKTKISTCPTEKE